jgi:hypothetical protein
MDTTNDDKGYARSGDPGTSHDAAERTRTRRTDDCNSVEAFLKKIQKPRKTRFEFTGPEIRARWIKAGDSTSRADSKRRRLSDLIKLGVVQDTGKRRGGSRILTLASNNGQAA